MDVYVLYGSNWSLRCLVGNTRIDSATSASLNANSMIFGNPYGIWGGDYSYYQSGLDYTEEELRGWVWAAWQVIVHADSITIRQWIKVGLEGDVIKGDESTPSFAELRTFILNEQTSGNYAGTWTQADADAWVPSDALRFQVGRDEADLCRVRMYGRSTEPSLAELNAISRNSAPDAHAWGDWDFTWIAGAPNLSDRSGNGRYLSVSSGGTLYEGSATP
jgi:hypothetical protein